MVDFIKNVSILIAKIIGKSHYVTEMNILIFNVMDIKFNHFYALHDYKGEKNANETTMPNRRFLLCRSTLVFFLSFHRSYGIVKSC